MVRFVLEKIRPGKGFAHFFHLSFVAVMPLILFVLVRLEFDAVALAVLLLSKWRMFAVRPRHWLAHVRTNAVDIIVGLSFLAFMVDASSMNTQLLLVLLYELWLLVIKPRSSVAMVSVQALIAQFLGLVALFYRFGDGELALYVVAFWAVAYFSARHFFGSFDEAHPQLLSSIWAFFSASLMWILGHWLLFVGSVAQPAILVTAIGYGFVALYYLDQNDRLSTLVRRQIVLTVFAIVFVMIAFSDWGDKAV